MISLPIQSAATGNTARTSRRWIEASVFAGLACQTSLRKAGMFRNAAQRARKVEGIGSALDAAVKDADLSSVPVVTRISRPNLKGWLDQRAMTAIPSRTH